MSKPVKPVTYVAVSKKLVIRALVQPDMGAKAALEIVDPISGVLLVAG